MPFFCKILLLELCKFSSLYRIEHQHNKNNSNNYVQKLIKVNPKMIKDAKICTCMYFLTFEQISSVFLFLQLNSVSHIGNAVSLPPVLYLFLGSSVSLSIDNLLSKRCL